MIKYFVKKYIWFFAFSFSVIYIYFSFYFIYPIHFAPHDLFFSQLINRPLHLSYIPIYFSGFVSIILMFLIAKKIHFKYIFLPSFLLSISPWIAYSLAAQSFYIYLLALLLFFFHTVLALKEKYNLKNKIVLFFSLILCLYSSLFLGVLVILMLGILILWKNFIKVEKRDLLIFLVFCLPLIFFTYSNFFGFKNIYSSEISFLSDPGLNNSVNNFYGQSQSKGFSLFAKISENKYIYTSKFLTEKIIKNVVPSSYFTAQEKLLDFSFQSPIYFGFIIPFMFGLYLVYKKQKIILYLIFFSILILPSFFSSKTVDLNRLLLVAPLVIFTISFGFEYLIANKGNKLTKACLFLSVLLIFIQISSSIFDMYFRELDRYQRYKTNFTDEISKQ